VSTAAEDLINEVRLLYQSLVQIGDRIHRESTITLGMRAVLEYLDRNGDTTVPDMARARRVSRQRIQALVNALGDEALVAAVDNPASRKSPLIRLEPEGAATILEMRRREARAMQLDVPETELRQAKRTLERVRRTLEENAGTSS
jgi:DNA-binding MarR family transcriptional regulator